MTDDLIEKMARVHWSRHRKIDPACITKWEDLPKSSRTYQTALMRAAYEQLPGNIKDQLEAMTDAR